MTAGKKNHKIRTALALMFIRLIPLWLILAAAIAAAVLFLPIFGKPFINLTSTQNISSSDIVLQEIRDIYRFNTVEYLYKIVFPFDFEPQDSSGWQILKKINAHLNQDPKKFLTPTELTWLKAIEISRRNRLKIYNPDYQFLVATVIIRAGFDLKASGMDQIETLQSTAKNRFISFSSYQRNGQTIHTALVTLPPAIISEVEIEDPLRDRYPFPDIGLDPKGWKEIAGFIQEQGQSRALNEGILAKAQTNAKNFITELLASIGVDEVSFN